jgi:chorismate dehydratase
MDKIKISAVKYANTYPFIYGLYKSGFDKKADVETDHPADCAAKLINKKVDIGLIPVATLPLVNNYHIISDYCIGAHGKVRTVMLLSNSPLSDVKKIYLDYRSRSSVNLTKVLAKNYWKKKFDWIGTSEKFNFLNIPNDEATVLIGDQCFEMESYFKFGLDLAQEWKDFTGLPFVFACWASNKKIDHSFLEEFNSALKIGLDNIDSVVEKFGKTGAIRDNELKIYLTKNIDFILDDDKIKGLNLFLEYLRNL